MSLSTCIWLGLFCGVLVTSQQQEADLQSLLHDTDVNRGAPNVAPSDDDDFEVEFVYPRGKGEVFSSNPVKRLWGVPDTKAFAGRLFSYPIPADAFEGDVKSYNVSSDPSWLSFCDRRWVFEGVPEPSDKGFHIVSVQAIGPADSYGFDDFGIHVTGISDSQLLKEARCSPKQDLTVVTLVLEKPTTPLLPRDKLQLIKAISKTLGVPSNKISLIRSSQRIDPLEEEGAIAAGPGKLRLKPSPADSAEGSQGQLQVQWSVGCDGELNKEFSNLLSILGASSKSGKLGDLIGTPVVGWMMTKVNPVTRRVRREVDYSGDYDDYDYDYYQKFFSPTNLDRSVPSLATPVFPDSPGTIYDGIPASPVFRPVPISTPVLVPVKPTRVVEASPTIFPYSSVSPFDAVDHRPDLESSLLTHPTTSADYTTPLTTSSSIYTDVIREGSAPIDVTSVPSVRVTTEYGVKNFPPRIKSRIQKLAWIAGTVYRLKIPEDTFYDVEDGGTRQLTLSLNDENGAPFSRDSWIQFDPVEQEVYALPLEKHIGWYHFQLQARDKDGEIVLDRLEINVRQDNRARNFHHQFTAVLKVEKKYEYDFKYSLDWQVKAVQKIASIFHDSVSSINVRNITINPVQISWTNTSLVESQSTVCPTEELEEIAEVMLSGHGSEPSRLAKHVFLPEFQLKKINSHFYDPCEPHFHHGRHHSHSETDKVNLFSPVDGPEVDPSLNSAPIIRNPIDQLKAVAGRLFRYQVPDNTCYDMEEGDSRNLKMQISTSDLAAPSEDSWLQFDSANQEFFGLPLKEDIGQMECFLECIDRGGESVSDALIVEVKEDEAALGPQPVKFGLTLDTSYEDFMNNAYDKARFMERLGRAFGDAGPENIAIGSIRKGSVEVEWHNISLPNDPCPYEEVERLRKIMTDDEGNLRKEFKDAFLPDFVVSSGDAVVPSGSCLAGDTPTHQEEPDVGGASPEEEEISSSSDEDYLLTFIIPAVIIAVLLILAALIACCLYRRRRYGKMSMAGDRTFVSKGIPIIFAEELDDHRPDSAKSPVIMKEEKPPLPPPEYQRNSPPRADRGQPHQRPHSGDMNSSEDAPYHRPPPFTASNGGSRNQRPNLPPAYRKPPTFVPP